MAAIWQELARLAASRCHYLRHVINSPDTFSATEVRHLLNVASNTEGHYPERMRAFAVALLEVLALEQPVEVLMALQVGKVFGGGVGAIAHFKERFEASFRKLSYPWRRPRASLKKM